VKSGRAGDGRGQAGTALDIAIPEGLRDVIGKRVSLLSKGVQPAAIRGLGHWT